jgi:hypothetical protein
MILIANGGGVGVGDASAQVFVAAMMTAIAATMTNIFFIFLALCRVI